MSISVVLSELVAKGRLIYVEPRRGSSAVRYVYLLDALHERIVRETSSGGSDGPLLARSMALLEAFIHGKAMSFGMDPFEKHPKALIARTSPVGKGIVDFRVLAPRPGMRVMGGFAAPDHFVGLRCFNRDEVKFLGGFGGCVQETSRVWDAAFGAKCQPIVSNNVNGYVTRNVLEV